MPADPAPYAPPKAYAPAPYKAPPPPKRGMKTAEIVEAKDTSVEEDTLDVKSSGLDKLRIDLTGPAAGMSASDAGVQVGK